MLNPQLHVMEIKRLLGNTPSPTTGDAKVRFAGFIEATEEFDHRHLSEVVSATIKGRLEGYNAAWPVQPAQIAAACRVLRNREVDLKKYEPDYVDPSIKPHLIPPPERSAESKARVLALARGYQPPPDPLDATQREPTEFDKRLERRIAASGPPQDPAAMARRLGFPGVARQIEDQLAHAEANSRGVD